MVRDPGPGLLPLAVAGVALLVGAAAAGALLPLADCPRCTPPNIFYITTDVVVPGAPFVDGGWGWTNSAGCERCDLTGRVTPYRAWRLRRARASSEMRTAGSDMLPSNPAPGR